MACAREHGRAPQTLKTRKRRRRRRGEVEVVGNDVEIGVRDKRHGH